MALAVNVSLTKSDPRLMLSEDNFDIFNSTPHGISKGNRGPEK